MKWFRIGILPIAMVIVLHSTALAATVQQSMRTMQTVQYNGLKLPEWATTITTSGGKLLLSDSPEIVYDDGITYQDIVQGDTRLFFHHVNGTNQPKKIVVLLENASDQPAHVKVSQYGLGGPGYNFLEVGKKVQSDYLMGDDVYLLEVPGNGSMSLIPKLDQSIVEPNMLVNGMYDFTTDAPVNVKVMMMPVNAVVEQFAACAKVLPADVGQYRLRGTFEGKDRLVVPAHTYDTKQHKAVAMTLADNKLDPFATGIDATDGTKTTNFGNYGIVYKIYVPATTNSKMSYYLNPRGGEYAGWLGVKYRHQEEYNIATPSGNTSFGSAGNGNDSAYIGTYEGANSLWLTFSPPGASNLPIKLIISPSK